MEDRIECVACGYSRGLKWSFRQDDVRMPMFWTSGTHATCEEAREDARCYLCHKGEDVPLWDHLNKLGADLGRPPWKLNPGKDRAGSSPYAAKRSGWRDQRDHARRPSTKRDVKASVRPPKPSKQGSPKRPPNDWSRKKPQTKPRPDLLHRAFSPEVVDQRPAYVPVYTGADESEKMFPAPDLLRKHIPSETFPGGSVWCGEAAGMLYEHLQGSPSWKKLDGACRLSATPVFKRPSGRREQPISASPRVAEGRTTAPEGLPEPIARLDEPAPGAMLRPAELREGVFGIYGLSKAEIVREERALTNKNLPAKYGESARESEITKEQTFVELPSGERQQVWVVSDDPLIWVTESDVLRLMISLADRRRENARGDRRLAYEAARDLLLGVLLTDYEKSATIELDASLPSEDSDRAVEGLHT